jgi:hypothetical protein
MIPVGTSRKITTTVVVWGVLLSTEKQEKAIYSEC